MDSNNAYLARHKGSPDNQIHLFQSPPLYLGMRLALQEMWLFLELGGEKLSDVFKEPDFELSCYNFRIKASP